jgi:small ligand-binding sensory domain FIST
MKAQAAIATGQNWREALDQAVPQLSMLADGTKIDITLLFASDAYAADFPALLAEVRRLTGGGVLLGCSGQGIIGPGREVEHEPAVSVQLFSLPGAALTPARLEPADVSGEDAPRVLAERLGHSADRVSAWLFFVDPFSVDSERLLALLAAGSDDVPLIGGLASGDFRRRQTFVFLNDDVFANGVAGVALGGAFTVRTIVSQGAMPIGEPWTITEADGNFIQTIGMRPALEVLAETFEKLPPELQRRAQSNVLVGLAIDEYRDQFERGDFLIRNLVAVDQEHGTIAVGAYPRVGQTIQFQLRDPVAADEELKAMLIRTQLDLGDQQPVGALLCSCTGRGAGLFGAPDHDAQALVERFGDLPVAGFFCNGEIGPVGAKNFLHGYTASIALILPVKETDRPKETAGR